MREERKKGKKKGIYTILMLICAVVFLFALYKVVDILMEYKQIDDFYDGAQKNMLILILRAGSMISCSAASSQKTVMSKDGYI